MIEQWKPVPGYEGAYEVSDKGRVRSIGRYVGAKCGSQRWNAGRILSPGRLPDGHLTVRPHLNGKGRTLGIHTLVLRAFVGPPPPGLECCHNNGRPGDNRLSNLRWDTPSANVLDQVAHGTHVWARRTHCKHGHELIESNVYRYGNKRVCKTCIYVRDKAYRTTGLVRPETTTGGRQ